MSQQGQWKASALAATFSSNSGLNGTAWGAARQPMHRGGEIGFGLGFGQVPMMNNMLLALPHSYTATAAAVASEAASGRSQKRKASCEDESMDGSSPTPEPIGRKIRPLGEPRRGADARKRTRMVMHTAAPNELVEPLEEKDLRALLDTLILHNPQLAAQVRQLVPKPTVGSACGQLVRLERRLQAAFPYNKSGPASDDYTYHRVRPALEELRTPSTGTDALGSEPQQPLNALSHPAEWFDLLAQATDVAMRMPKWDKPENNDVRRDTLRQLADGWLRAIMATARWTEEGHIVGRDMLSQWAQQLDHFYAASGESALFQPAVQVFQRSFGQHCFRSSGRMSLQSTA
ncbi:hypothetical protein BX661DRAFT_180374 [Kickxella alabastrina]|uniref:uncharacterized protein n=1 Tax=Kickxella alabastrina TaxID=61397 RepID=UPI00221F8C09|nr:uncharacterized protein BX661DRAFT_180374 [Kickxella alabastrina]KAI7830959.1 hypothetical protein BX661DRAFT_180374 [Kickxella alabastrina]